MNLLPAQKSHNNNQLDNPVKVVSFLTTSEAAKLLNISPSTLRRMEDENRISSIRKPNGYRAFDREEVLSLKSALKLEAQKENEARKQHAELRNKKQKILKSPLFVGMSKIATAHKYVAKTAVQMVALLLVLCSAYLNYKTSGGNFAPTVQAQKALLQNLNPKPFIHNLSAEVTQYLESYDNGSRLAADFGNEFAPTVLGTRDSPAEFVFNVNVPTNLNGDVTIVGDISADSLSLIGAIDTTTQTTLQTSLILAGEVTGPLSANIVSDGVIDGDNFTDTITFDGDFNLTGNVDISGPLALDGDEGSDGQILSSTGGGTLVWIDVETDAETVGGISPESFLRSDTSDAYTSGTLTTNSGTILDINGDLTIADTDIAFDGATTTFTTTGDLFIQGAAGNQVTIGGTSVLAKLGIDGNADEIQFLVQGNATQTSSLVVFEQSDGTNLFELGGTGNFTLTNVGTSNSVIRLSGSGDLTINDNGGGVFVTFTDNGDVNIADDALLDLSSVTHNDSAPQGLKLPQATTLTAMVAAGEGYIAWDTDADQLQVFDGTSWTTISGGSSLFTDGGTTTYLTSTTDDLAIGGTDSEAALFLDVSASALNLNPFGAGSGNTGEVRFQELEASGDNYTGFKSPDTLAGNVIYTLPTADATSSNQVLSSDSAGVLSWIDVSAGAGSLWTDGGAITYLTSTSDDLAIGGSTSSSELFFDTSAAALTLNPFDTGTGDTGEIRFAELAAGGTNYTGFKAADSLAGNVVYTLPTADATSANQVLSSNSSGVLSWIDVSSGAGSLWTDSGTTTYLTTTTDELVLGGTTPLSSAKFSIDGDADQIQLILQGNGTQTANIFEIETSGTTDLFTVDNSGNVFANGTLNIDGAGTHDIAGILNLSGNTLSSSGDLLIDPAGQDVTIDGDLLLSDTFTLQVGGKTGVAYNAFADAGDAPDEAAITGDNDVYIGGDLEVDGTIYGAGSISGFTEGSVIFADSAGTLTEDNASLFWDDTSNFLGIGTSSPSAKLTITNDVASTTFIESSRTNRSNSGGVGANWIGSFDSTYLETQDGGLDEAGRIGYKMHVTTDGASGGGTNNASAFFVYTERETFDDMIPVFSAYATSGTRYLCMNGIENENTANWDCFGMTIGSANAVAFAFDGGTNRFSFAYNSSDTSVAIAAINSADNLDISTQGDHAISFIAGNASSGADDMTLLHTGELGIGTTGPDRRLDVLHSSAPQMRLTHTDGTVYTDFQTTSAGELVISPSGTNVGIGASDPTGILDIEGATPIVYINATGSTDARFTLQDAGTDKGHFWWDQDLNNLVIENDVSLGTIVFNNNGGQWHWYNDATATAVAVMEADGNLGIGTTDPSGRLEVLTTGGSDLFIVEETAITSAVPHSFTAAGDVSMAYDLIFTNQTSSLIESYAPLTIRAGESSESNDLTLETYNSGNIYLSPGKASVFTKPLSYDSQETLAVNDTTPDVSGGSHFITANTAGTVISDFDAGSGSLEAGHIIFIEVNDANTDFDCTASGLNCGSGDIDIVVAGDIIFFIYDGTDWNLLGWMDDSSDYGVAGGADLAEYFVSGDTLVPGDVVSIDPNNQLKVKKSAQEYDPKAVGIVSTNPGLILGEQTEKAHLIALAGRVPTKISPTSAAIVPGDYITAAPGGLAKKSVQAGRVIGVAMESWTPGTSDNDIIVFVNPTWHDPLMALGAYGELVNTVDSLALSVSQLDQVLQASSSTTPSNNYASSEDVISLSDTVDDLDLRLTSLETQTDQNASELSELKDELAFINQLLGLEDAEESSESTGSGSPTQTTLSGLTETLSQMLSVYNEFQEFVAALGINNTLSEDGKSVLNIASDLNVTGETSLYDTTITGDLSVGLIEIDSLNNNIGVVGPECYNADTQSHNSALCEAQTLYLQNGLAGNVDILNGVLVIAPDGTVDVNGTLTANKLAVDVSNAEAPAAGKVIIPAGQLSVIVTTKALTLESLILATPETPAAVGAQATGADTFEITLTNPRLQPLEVSWLIVDAEGN